MTIIKHILSGFGALSMLLLFSCTNDPIIDSGQPTSSELTLLLSVDGLITEAATRVVVDATDDEQVVHTLDLFFFEHTSNQSGIYIDVIRLTNPSLTGNTPIPTASSPVSASGAYKVIGVANASLYDFDTAAWSGKTEKDFRDNAMAILRASSTIESAGILMNATTDKVANEGSIHMKLTRNAARFDVVNNANGYTLVSASLRNVYNCSSITGDMALDYSRGNVAAREAVSSIASTTDNKISGRLYAFENLSTAPALGDEVTTCYIVELEKAGEAAGKFHRINVHPNEDAQHIKRNKVYIVSIADVTGDGYDTADEAYVSNTNELNYTINNWDLGDNGLVVSNSYSILAVPVKTIQFGTAGGANRYTIATFSTLSNPSPLAMKNTDIPAGVTCTLVNNVLTVTASALGAEENRSGSITLTYAGLEATVNILQSITVEAFLELSYEEGWVGLLSPVANQKTKSVYVYASGEWSAEIIGDDGFVFDLNGTTEITSADAAGNSFIIRTLSANPSDTEIRKAFVIVSLNDDPVNHVGVVSLTQAASGAP